MPLASRDLEYFLEIARLGQLAQAAVNLEVTPAALSKAVRRLESELGLPLFERTGQGMALTPYGATFHDRAQRLKHDFDDALRHAGEVRAGRAGRLRIGATIAVLEPVVTPVLARLQPQRPGLHAVLTVAASDELLERVRRGSLDLAVVPTYGHGPQGLVQRVLGSDELVAVVRDTHPALRRRRAELADLVGASWILPREGSAARRQLDQVFARLGVAVPNAAVEVDFNSSWALPLVRATDLVGLVPRSALNAAAPKGLRVIGQDVLCIRRRVCVFSRPDSTWSPLAREFAELLRA